MTGDDLRALSAAATPGPWRQSGPGDHAGWVFMSDAMPPERQIVGAVIPDRPTDAELIVWLRNHADALADLIDAAHLVLPDFDGGVAYKLDTDNLRGLGNALLALEADA